MSTHRRIIILIIGFILVAGAFTPLFVFAQETKDLSIQLSGFLGKTVSGLPEYIAMIYNYAIGLAISLAIFMVMLGGFFRITAAGDRGKVTKANNLITDAVIGLILTLGAYVILNTINPALLKLEMPGIKKVTGIPWESKGCAEKPSDCPEGQTPINCNCVKTENLEVGGRCLAGDAKWGDAYCQTQCQGCTCHEPPPKTCIAKAAEISAAVTLTFLGGAAAMEIGSVSNFVQGVQKFGKGVKPVINVVKKGGKLFFKIPYAKETVAAAGTSFTLFEGCRQLSDLCKDLTEGMAKEIGITAVEEAASVVSRETQMVWANLAGTLGHCYTESYFETPNGGFCGKDSHCHSGNCVPLNYEAYKESALRIEEGKCIGILDTLGVCSSGEKGGSCWFDSDCKQGQGLKCVTSVEPSVISKLTGAKEMKACSDGSEGSACLTNDDCAQGLKCEEAVMPVFDPLFSTPKIKKCERIGGGGQESACNDNLGCKAENFPEASSGVPKNYKDPICILVTGESYIVSKFVEHNKGKNGRCGRAGYEYGDPCYQPGVSFGKAGGCRQGLTCSIQVAGQPGVMRKYTESDYKDGWWGKCCRWFEGGGVTCKVPK